MDISLKLKWCDDTKKQKHYSGRVFVWNTPRSISYKVSYISDDCDKREKFTGRVKMKIMTLLNMHAFCQSNELQARLVLPAVGCHHQDRIIQVCKVTNFTEVLSLILRQKSGWFHFHWVKLYRHVDFPLIFNFSNFAAFLLHSITSATHFIQVTNFLLNISC